jgi:hypothetical protein
MAWTYDQVKAADAALGISNPAAAAAALNAQTVSVPVDLQWSAIRDLLMNNFDWGTLVAVSEQAVGDLLPGGGTQTFAIKSAACAIRECCLYGGTFNSSNATVWGRLTTAAGLLTPANVGGISSASASAVGAARLPAVARWAPAIDAGHIQTARAQ